MSDDLIGKKLFGHSPHFAVAIVFFQHHLDSSQDVELGSVNFVRFELNVRLVECLASIAVDV